MPRFLDGLLELTEFSPTDLIHINTEIGGVRRDRKMTITNFLAGIIPRTVAGKYRFKLDGSFQLWSSTSGKFHTLSIDGADGSIEMTFDIGED